MSGLLIVSICTTSLTRRGISKFMEITFEATRIRLAAFQLEGLSKLGLGQSLKELGGNDVGRLP